MSLPTVGRAGLAAYAPASSTATITNGSANVPFTGTAFAAADANGVLQFAVTPGDLLVVDGVGEAFIKNVVDATNLQLTRPWSFATQTAIGAGAWYILRMSVSPQQALQAAVNQLLNMGTETFPDQSRWIDDTTARVVVRLSGGKPTFSVGVTGANVGGTGGHPALIDAIQIDPATGIVSDLVGAKANITGFRNRLLNGTFLVAQGPTSFTLANGGSAYTLDQWLIINNSGASATVSRIAAPAGVRGRYALNIAVTGAIAGGTIDIIQRFEANAVYDHDGVNVTYSHDINATTTAGSLTATARLLGNTAVDNGTFSSVLYSGAFSSPAGGAIPVGSGVMSAGFGSVNTTGLKNGAQVVTRLTQNTATGNINASIGCVAFEAGIIAQNYEFRPEPLELAMCQRFYRRVRIGGLTGIAGGATSVTIGTQFPDMRVAPSGNLLKTTFNSGGGGAGFELWIGAAFPTNAAASMNNFVSDTKTATWNIAGFSGLTAGVPALGNNGNPADVAELIARL
jgi:hypothetical protein